MKQLFISNFAVAAIALASSAGAQGLLNHSTFKALATEVPAPIENVFIPQGFDSNDNAEIVVSGTFPNSCYKVGKITHQFNQVEKKIFVNVTAYHIKSDYCLAITVPFIQVVQLGAMDPAQYPVVVNDVINTMIPIHKAPDDSEKRDDFMYASVYGLIQKAPNIFEIQGVSPNACYEVSKVEVIYESKNVVTVLPIMELIAGCDQSVNKKPVAWIQQFEVSKDLKGKTLIHVRTLNGGSINQVVEL